MSRVAIQIVTKDRFLELSLLLSSLRFQTFKNWDLYVIDGSKPHLCVSNYFINGLITRLKSEGHKVIIMPEEVPGVCQCRNQAIKLSKENGDYNYFCRIDDDSILEPDYLERLYKLIQQENIGAVGGIVPMFGTPSLVRNINKAKPIFNKIEIKDKNITKMADDGGVHYNKSEVIESHHLRSSFMWRSDLDLEFPEDYGISGFREETDFCLKILMKGYKLLTDTGAVCWHLRTPSGGLRFQGYNQDVALCDAHFKKKVQRWKRQNKLKLA